MTDIVGLVLPFFGMIFLGALVARITRQPIEGLAWMNTFVVYVALPALFFLLVSRTPVEQLAQWSFILGSIAATYIIFGLMFAVSVFIQGDSLGDSTIKGLSAAYGNIGYMGPGIALIAFGESAAVPVALIFCFENMVHFAVAPMMMAFSGAASGSRTQIALDILRQIALHPFIIATFLGVAFAFSGLSLPSPANQLLEYLSRAAAPCALFAMGVTLALRPLKRVPRELGLIVALKLVVHPLLVYVILSAIGNFPPNWIYVAMLMAALPTATNVFVMGQQYGFWVQRASASVLITTVLSVGTVTALLYAIRAGLLPPDLFP
jgi:malonate transporter